MSAQKGMSVAIEPPLTKDETIKVDPNSGREYVLTKYRRGLLGTDTTRYTNFVPRDLCEAFAGTPRQDFELWCEELRNYLERVGLPSDRTPRWIKLKGEEWRPIRSDEDVSAIKPPFSYAYWTKRVQELTEPLSEARIVADLLWHLLLLLQQPKIDEHLWHIGQVLTHYARFRISGPINNLATQGLAASRGRMSGPKARQSASVQRRNIIWMRAQELWASKRHLNGDAFNTALHIAEDVNNELSARHLLGKHNRRLSSKTIADHIRICCRGQILRTGHSGDENGQSGILG
jgi:hypothetical protein